MALTKTPICDKHSFVPMGIQTSSMIPLYIGHQLESALEEAKRKRTELETTIFEQRETWDKEAWRQAL